MVKPLPSNGERRRFERPRPLNPANGIGVHVMRSNSGRDESRNNLHDPTLRDRDPGRSGTTMASKKPKAPADHRQGQQDKSPKTQRTR